MAVERTGASDVERLGFLEDVNATVPQAISACPDNRFRWPRRGGGAACAMVSALVGMILWSGRSSSAGTLQMDLHSAIQAVEFVGVPPCGLVEHGVAYNTLAGEVGQYSDINYHTVCRHKCFLVAECQIWSWSSDGICRLIRLDHDENPSKAPLPGGASGGMPCGMREMLAPGTLYCWALVQPGGYEVTMLSDQYTKHVGIFNCEEHAILSNQIVEVAPGYNTQLVNTTLDCSLGGEFGTALNLDIFIAVWNRIVELGTYASHDWTVKCDPDAVFFADRLLELLPHHPEEAKGVYLNNCKYGMHGPLEVFSRSAVTALTYHWQECQDHFRGVCNGDCQWGEDMFIDQCLEKVAYARRDNEWSLLVEDHCTFDGIPWSYTKCDGLHVAFHPFKDPESYAQCLSNSWALAEQAVAEQNQEVPGP